MGCTFHVGSLSRYLKFLLGKNAGKFICERRNQNSKSAKPFMGKGMTLLGFLVMAILHGGIDFFVVFYA